MGLCCVVGCHRNTKRDKGTVGFYRFPKRNFEQRQLWIKAVKRINPDGSEWMPSANTRICSDHFVNGEVHPSRNHPSYVPSIFPTKHKKPKGITDADRFDRARKRQKLVESSSSLSAPSKSNFPMTTQLSLS